MKAGKMRYRLRLLRPVVTVDMFRSEHTEYEETRTVWAERVKAVGSYGEEVWERFPSYTVEFNIRDAHEVSENWRVEQLGGYLYTVENIIPKRERGMLTLRCERVNP